MRKNLFLNSYYSLNKTSTIFPLNLFQRNTKFGGYQFRNYLKFQSNRQTVSYLKLSFFSIIYNLVLLFRFNPIYF